MRRSVVCSAAAQAMVLLLLLSSRGTTEASEDAGALYEITTEIGMPHLEEALRYTITHEKRCLTPSGLHHLFPILTHPALTGCHLGNELREGDLVSYPLVCQGDHGTTGSARWEADKRHLTGTLDVKLGGKNMTFYQRITAIPLGACP